MLNSCPGGVGISDLENVAGSFFTLLSYMRDKFFRPLEQKTRSQLSPLQHIAVSTLYRRGSLSMSELALAMQVSKQQLTPLVDKLINQGLLAKNKDQNDRRVMRIEVTEQGRNMFSELFAEIKCDLVEKLGALPGEDLDELGRLLKRILRILKNIEKAQK